MYKTFEEARKFVRSLGLKTQDAWHEYAKSESLPTDIPNTPRVVYKKEWKSMGDWIGTDYIANRYRIFWSYEKASAFLIKLGIKDKTDFERKCKSGKIPKEIPRDPRRVYKKQGTWKDWGDFLGTGRTANQNMVWPSAKEARIEIKKIAKDVFGGKPFTPKDWINAHKAGKIPANLPRYLKDIYGLKKSRKK